MRIIKQGRAVSEINYIHTCHSCGTQFIFNLNEVSPKSDQRENSRWYECQCPYVKCKTPQYIEKLVPYVDTTDPY
jgi:hypothetical protein